MGCQALPITSANLYRYAAYLARTLQFNSISKYLNIIRIMHLESGLDNPIEDNWGLKTILAGIKRVKGAHVTRKLPITPQILIQIRAILVMDKVDDAMFWAACLVGFFGFLRKSNLFPHSASGHDPRKHLSRCHFIPCQWGFELTVDWSKNNQYREHTVTIPLLHLPGPVLCPVSALKWAFMMTVFAPSDGPAFVMPCKLGFRPLLYGAFVSRLKQLIKHIGLDPKLYASHSLRRGGATWAASIGLPGEVIQMMGDWHSDAYLLYLSIPMSAKVKHMVTFTSNLPVE